MQKRVVMNSMVGAKMSMAKDKPIQLVIDWKQSLPLLPAIDIKM